MAGLLDFLSDVGEGISQLPQAIAGAPPPVDPSVQQMLPQGALQNAQQQYNPNFWNSFAQASGSGQGFWGALGNAHAMAGQAFGGGLNNAINAANALRQNRVSNMQYSAWQNALNNPTLSQDDKDMLQGLGPQGMAQYYAKKSLEAQTEAARKAALQPHNVTAPVTERYIMRQNPDGTISQTPNPNFNEASLKQPNATIQLPQNTMELMYQRYLQTNKLDTTGFSRSPGTIANLWNYIGMRAAQDGNTAAATYANSQSNTAAGQVLKSYESGNDHKTLLAVNTAVNHMTALDPLIDAMQNGDTKTFNALANAYAKQFNVPAPTNYEMLKNMVVGEVAKAVYNMGGTKEERDALAAPLENSNGPAILKGAAHEAAVALAGKTDALKQAWDSSTNGRYGDFDKKFLSPATLHMLGRTPMADPNAPPGAGPPAPPVTPTPAAAGPTYDPVTKSWH